MLDGNCHGGLLHFQPADGHAAGNVAPTAGGSQGETDGEPRAERRDGWQLAGDSRQQPSTRGQPAGSLSSEPWQVVVQGIVELKWICLGRTAASLLSLHDPQKAAINPEEFFQRIPLVEEDPD